jgi:hypothetical protein
MAMERFRFGNLPIPPAEYSPEHLRQAFRVLELYFDQLDSQTPNQAESYRANFFYGGEFVGDVTGGNVTAGVVTADLLNAVQAYIFALTAQATTVSYLNADAIYNRRYLGSQAMIADVYSDYFYGNGRYISTPYNQLISNTDQAAVALDVAYAITYDTTDFPDGITVTNNSRINFAESGIYNIVYSIQFENDNNSTEFVDIWLRYEGTDIAGTNSRFSLPPRKSALEPSTLIAVTPIMVDIENDGDYIEIMWHPSDLGVTIEHYNAVTYSAGVTPAIPATPSVIVGVTFISAQFPPTKRVAPLPVFGFGQVGTVTVTTNLG